ncbi:hypothetical protein J7L87_01620, partial [bacterium]|nr:hypothetical protein [bacterium]
MIEINILKKRWERFFRKIIFIRIISFYLLGLFLILSILGIEFISNKLIISRIKTSIDRLKENV